MPEKKAGIFLPPVYGVRGSIVIERGESNDLPLVFCLAAAVEMGTGRRRIPAM